MSQGYMWESLRFVLTPSMAIGLGDIFEETTYQKLPFELPLFSKSIKIDNKNFNFYLTIQKYSRILWICVEDFLVHLTS